MRTARFWILAGFWVSLTLGCGPGEQAEPPASATNGFDAAKSDPKALAVVDELWAALGGKDAWPQARYLSFRWIVAREGNKLADIRHHWDRGTGRYRVEGTSRRDQTHFVVLFNTATKEGDVYLNGEPVTVDSIRTQWLERGYARFINDSYWLLMPYKLKDPGVVLHYDGEKTLDGRTYDVVKVTFENVGLTPGDTYWAFIDKEDRLMHRWEYVLQSYKEGQPATGWWWRDWQTFGGIKLATDKVTDDGTRRIYFEDIVVAAEPDEAIFANTHKTVEP